MRLLNLLRAREERKFWALAIWLLAIFLMGGGARDDITSLMVLRPLGAAVLALAIYKVSTIDMRPYRLLLALLAAIIGLVALHLIPLPPAVWRALPQRELIADIDHAAGLGAIWRPLSIAPLRTWNALLSLMIPLSVVLLAIRLDDRQLKGMVTVVLAIGLLSVMLGALQVVGGADALYLYKVHNAGAADGLFANRNHQGAFLACLLPLLAVFSTARTLDGSQRRFRTIIAATAALTLVPIFFITGSRAGLLLGLVSFVASILVMGPAETNFSKRARGKGGKSNLKKKRFAYAGFVLTAVVLILVTVFASRAEALHRLLTSNETEELRIAALQPVTKMALDYMPLGSGAGTFVEAFFRAEPRVFLSPTYFNHAHFDYLEWAVTGGVPALAILAVVIGFAVIAAIRLFLRSRIGDPGVQLGRAGLVITALLAAASIVDYPVRTPAISALVALAAVWIWRATFAEKSPSFRHRAGNHDPITLAAAP